jgi:hypothetical protein
MRVPVAACLVLWGALGCARQPSPPQETDVSPVTGEPCLAVPEQTGAGCDQEGILQVMSQARRPEGAIPSCYRAHVGRPREIRLSFHFALTPEGRATAMRWNRLEPEDEGFRSCFEQFVRTVQFPAPGDVPCQIVYPLTLIPRTGP